MQESDCSGSKRADRSSGIEIEGYGCLALSGLGRSAETHAGTGPGVIGMKEAATCEAEQTSKLDNVSASGGADNEVEVEETNGHSVLPESDGSSAVGPEVREQQREHVVAASFDEEKSIPYMSGDYGSYCTEGVQADIQDKTIDTEGFLISKDSQERPLESKMVSLSSGADVSSISLSELAKVLRELDEDEFRFLFMSREASANAELRSTGCSNVTEYEFSDVLESLKEQLYLTNFAKYFFRMQLDEQSELQMQFDHQSYQLVDSISIANASLTDVGGRNESLVEELAQCRSELQAVACARQELQKQLHTAKAEVEESSGRADELHSKLERSQGDLSSLSAELVDCRDLVAALQVENENLNGSLTLVTEENKKLEEEKRELLTEVAECKGSLKLLQVQNVNLNGSLALLTEERRKFEEEKENVVCENQKLLTDVGNCKVLVEGLQVENANLNGILTSVTEERKKLGEEKEYFVHETKKLSTELTDSKGLVDALQVEIDNLNGSLTSVMEERNKLWEEKEHFVSENEKLLAELADCKGLVAGLQVEHSKVVGDLKEATLRLEQLTEGNVFLNSSLDMHKPKMIESDARKVELSSQSGEAVNQVEGSDVPSRGQESATDNDESYRIPAKGESELFHSVLQKPLSDDLADWSSVKQLKLDAYDDSFGFVVLKGHLEEVEKIMQKLEKAIERMHSHTASLSQSSGKVVTPGVSKLIQAFESKAHLDDHEVEEVASTENQSLADPFMLGKEQTENLRAVLKEFGLEAENTSKLFKGERDGRILANVAFRELNVTYEALKEHSNNLEAGNIELVVLYEIIKQHVCDTEAKKGELLVLCEALRQHDIILKAENSELGQKQGTYQSKIIELQRQLDEIHLSSEEMASSIYNQVENLHKEVVEGASILDQEWNSIAAQVVQTVGKLDASIGSLFSSTPSTGSHDGQDIGTRVAASVDAATKVIEDLQEKLKATNTDHEAMCSSYKKMTQKFNKLHGKNELAIDVLHKIYGNLRKLLNDSCGYEEQREIKIQNEELLDPLHLSYYDTAMEQLGKFLGERLQLESLNNKLNSELMDRAKEIEELNERCLDLDAILKLFEDVEDAAKLEDTEIDSDKPMSRRLESLISFLVKKYKEADEQVSLSREKFGSKEMELQELKGQIDQISFVVVEHENEILILKESLRQTEENLVIVRTELQEKVTELEQSEQRVSSLREKLSIAVSKGKGLIVQRDSLKQSLAETSSELVKCSQELQLKDARLHEVETTLKTYSEAGDRVEALESELSYIRNSATALRESFLLKDSVLQRIEEILEDLELPEQFHSRDIIEKVDWLARSVTGNALPLTDWDQKSSVGGGSYSDAGFVVMDPWKEDVQPNLNSGDDLRRKYEELQSKFYGLAEQNEMLEQSLMERNNLVQRWEEILDRINMPSQLRSMEPEKRIEWLGSALSEAHQQSNSLQQKIDNLETLCGSLTSDLEESQTKISDLEVALQAVIHEKEHFSENLEILTRDYDKVSENTVKVQFENEKLQNEVTVLQENMVGAEEHIRSIEGEIRRMQNLVIDVLQDPATEYVVSGDSSTECLERLLSKLIDKYMTIPLRNSVIGDAFDEHVTEKADATHDKNRIGDSRDVEEKDVAVLKKELEDALGDLMYVKEERDRYMQDSQSWAHEVEALGVKTQELQELLSLEEQKSASVREKLNVAVRKGKSLVQQRDSLRQTIEEVNTELELLKSEISFRENTLSEYEQKIKDLSTYPERVEALESESLFLRNRLAETEYSLQGKGHTLSMILNILGNIDVGFAFNINDPVEKLEQIGKLCCDLHAAVASSEQDLRKSKRAAELLLAELNEVQERNDGLQEELAKAASELSELSKERDSAEAAKSEALSRLEKLSAVHSEERNSQFAELMVLKSGVDQLTKGLFDINNLLGDVLSKDLDVLHNLEASMKSCLKLGDAPNMVGLPLDVIIPTNSEKKENFLATDLLLDTRMQEHFDESLVIETCSLVGRQLQDFTAHIGALKEKLHKHLISIHEEAKCLSELVGIVRRDVKSLKESLESMKENISQLKCNEKEKDTEIVVMRRSISLLYEACTSSIMEIENWKVQLVGNGLATADLGINLESSTSVDGGNLFSRQTLLSSEECIRTMADRLVSVVKDSVCMEAEIVEGGQKEMKSTISNLQKELREKDIHKERICVELVSQIKEAEAAARSSLQDLQSATAQVHDLERKVELMEEEHNMLEQRVKELQDGEASLKDLQERVRSLTDVLAAKEQEIEALMQALDVEETQMEDLINKIAELEKVVQQKNLDLENLEASRGKAMKKLSITVSKFDELHHLSASLLSEVEKLQSQLQERDAEISFLRQEVTRCTNDALVASQMSNKRNSDEIHDLLTWVNAVISRVQVHDVHFDDKKNNQLHEFKEVLQKQIISIISELEDLRVVAQNRDTLLQAERSRVEELLRKEEFLENSLHEKESQLTMLRGVGDSGQATSTTSEIMEVEPVINKWAAPGTSIAPQVRSLRKVNNDQVAIAIDMDPGSGSRLEDEDDDKAHGFKSLTTSRIVPRFTRPVTDMIDGLWVSCDRALMRQPALRLGVIIYWAVLHALLATFVV
uniref:Putative GRIP and coiled-coil domain-containing protein 2 isoform X2 n=1 Tax=Davidia involucrata TaxID=16924 RepID=A0A5B7BVZ1_DAVIN